MKEFEEATARMCKIFSGNFKTLLKEKQINGYEFCRQINTNPGNANHWMNATNIPRKPAMIAICNHFEFYDIYALLTRKIDLHDRNPYHIETEFEQFADNKVFSSNLKLLLAINKTNPYRIVQDVFHLPEFHGTCRSYTSKEPVCFPKWSHLIALCDHLHFTNIYQLLTSEIDIGDVVNQWKINVVK